MNYYKIRIRVEQVGIDEPKDDAYQEVMIQTCESAERVAFKLAVKAQGKRKIHTAKKIVHSITQKTRQRKRRNNETPTIPTQSLPEHTL